MDTSSSPQAAPAACLAALPTPVTAQRRVDFSPLPQSLGLSESQRTALQALAAGHGPVAAAAIAGVHPATLFRWRKRNARFIAAFNAWRKQVAESTHARLLAAGDHAATTVLRACENGDV